MVMVRPNVGTFQVDCAGAQLANATSGVGRHGYANASLSPLAGEGWGEGSTPTLQPLQSILSRLSLLMR